MKAWIAGFLLLACLVPASAQNTTHKKTTHRRRAAAITPEQTCRAFVQKFYAWYTSKPIQENHEVSADHLARKQHPDYFAPALKKALETDEAAASKSPDEVVGLDGDPFLNAQELDDRYYAGLATIDDGVCKVPIFGVNRPPNPPTDRHMKHLPAVTALLKNQGGKWVFQDFQYDGNETLLSVLAQLAKDRQHPPAEKPAENPPQAAPATPAATSNPVTPPNTPPTDSQPASPK